MFIPTGKRKKTEIRSFVSFYSASGFDPSSSARIIKVDKYRKRPSFSIIIFFIYMQGRLQYCYSLH